MFSSKPSNLTSLKSPESNSVFRCSTDSQSIVSESASVPKMRAFPFTVKLLIANMSTNSFDLRRSHQNGLSELG